MVMMTIESRGDFIQGRFVKPKGQVFESKNPSKNFEAVCRASYCLDSLPFAVECAHKAYTTWSTQPLENRIGALRRLAASFEKKQEAIAKAITLEMGKPIWESRLEAKNLGARIELMISEGLKRVQAQTPKGVNGEVRYHPQGALAVLGPFNFPAHLINAHVIPALLLGNTVVVKPSEVCPLVGELYASCVLEAELPPGVFNLLQGGREVGEALVAHPLLSGVLFTGSYEAGARISQTLLSQPHKIAALEMGGKNIGVVLKDADLKQALNEVVLGAFLTTGQRCTATSRLMIEKTIAKPFLDAFQTITKSLFPGDPLDENTLFGPLATQKQLSRYLEGLEEGKKHCEVLLDSQVLEGGSFVTPSLYLYSGEQNTPYLQQELFGPHVCIELIDGLDEAIHKTNQSPYGLSNAIFTHNKSQFEAFYQKTKSGVLNWNKSTNGSSGQMPFGGVGKSGNQRPSGIEAVKYVTYPVAIHHESPFETPPKPFLPYLKTPHALEPTLKDLVWFHSIEQLFEYGGIPIQKAENGSIWVPLSYPLKGVESLYPDAFQDENCICFTLPKKEEERVSYFIRLSKWLDQWLQENPTSLLKKPMKPHVPENLLLPRSENLLKRLYANDFVPKEKKTPVVDLMACGGGYLVSADPEPLVIVDAASQIASLAVGFSGDDFQKALDEGEWIEEITANKPTPKALEKQKELEELLASLSHFKALKQVTFVCSGAEANEKALDLCRQNGAFGKRVLAYEGSFHGRTWMALQATYNPEKRAQFELLGYEVSFIPFPENKHPHQEGIFSKDWIELWSKGQIPSSPDNDPLLKEEIQSLKQLHQELEKGDVCAVIIEPMQCEGGERYATSRFFHGLRALTRFHQVNLIFDEVQTGFGLLGPFFAHTHFQLRNAKGEPDGPDCITMAKKAQVGIVLSHYIDQYPKQPHYIHMMRGLLQAKAVIRFAYDELEKNIQNHLKALQHEFPMLMENARNKGYAFAFDMLFAHVANQVIAQRFYRGFMVYVAGVKTLRFRANTKTTEQDLSFLFKTLRETFLEILRFCKARGGHVSEEILKAYQAKDYVQLDPLLAGKPTLRKTPDFDLASILIEPMDAIQMRVFEPQMQAIECMSYEKNRQDSMEYLRSFMEQEGGLCLVMTALMGQTRQLIGYAVGGPLEHSQAEGPLQDPMRGKGNAFYSTNLTIHPKAKGFGLGIRLKKAQIEWVTKIKNAQGKQRYQYIVGRNRLGFTKEMEKINQHFGAYEVAVYDNQYGEKGAKCVYYRMPLKRPQLLPKEVTPRLSLLDWSRPNEAPLGSLHPSLLEAYQRGHFTTACLTKLTLSNFITSDVVRYGELLKKIGPKACQHVYFTSGQEEMVDKGLRALRCHRPKAQMAIGFRKQYLGLSTSAARSLTEPSEFSDSRYFKWFDWPLLPHPLEEGYGKTKEALENLIQTHGADSFFGLVVELLGEKTGYGVQEDWLLFLDEMRQRYQIPLIFVETASALGRNGQSLFYSDALSVKPNMVWWYAGGQLGHIFVDDTYYVSKPLTLISTWDGDEISMRRSYVHILEAIKVLEDKKAIWFEELLSDTFKHKKWFGKGFYYGLELPNRAMSQQVLSFCKAKELYLGKGFSNTILITPSLHQSRDQLKEGLKIVEQALYDVGL